MTKTIMAIMLLPLVLAGCADCGQECSAKGYPDDRCDSLCSSPQSLNQAPRRPADSQVTRRFVRAPASMGPKATGSDSVGHGED